MAPRIDCTNRIPSGVASSLTRSNEAEGWVCVDLRAEGNFKFIIPGLVCGGGVANRGVVVTEAGSYLRLIHSCITQLKAQGPFRTCNESKEEEEAWRCRVDREGL